MFQQRLANNAGKPFRIRIISTVTRLWSTRFASDTFQPRGVLWSALTFNHSPVLSGNNSTHKLRPSDNVS